MEFKIIKQQDSKRWDMVWNLYENSFPEAERRKIEDHIRASEDEHFYPLSIWDNNQLIGLAFYWQWNNYRYIEYLAVSPALHGHGYGSQIIRHIRDSEHIII